VFEVSQLKLPAVLGSLKKQAVLKQQNLAVLGTCACVGRLYAALASIYITENTFTYYVHDWRCA
jgi:hypothetical protein